MIARMRNLKNEDMSYTREETIQKLNGFLGPEEISYLYNKDFLNWSSKTKDSKDSKEFYTEVIAEQLLWNLKSLEGIQQIEREQSYRMEAHGKAEMNLQDAAEGERVFGKRLARLNLDYVGKILDFEVPLKKNNEEYGGEIDLLSYSQERDTLYLLELKNEGNDETLLRAMLESYTYYRNVYREKLIRDYEDYVKSNATRLVPAVIVTPGCNAYDEMCEMENGERPKLQALALALGIKFFIVEINVDEAQL